MIEKITFSEARTRLNSREGLVLLGCGGALTEWTNGVTKTLKEEGIAASADPEQEFGDCYELTTSGGRTDLLLLFKEEGSTLNMGKMAMWRLRFGDASWWSDYIVNYAGQHGFQEPDEENEEEHDAEAEFEARREAYD